MTIVSAAAGAYTHLFTNLLRGGGLLYGLLGMGLALGLYATPDNGKNRPTRMALLLGFAFFSGLGTGPLLDMALRINPSLIPNAFLLSGAIFACFSGAALFAPDGQYLYLGGTLLSGLSTLFWLGFLNIFFQSQLIFQVRFFEAQNLLKINAILYFRSTCGEDSWCSVDSSCGIPKWSLKRDDEVTEISSLILSTFSLTLCKSSEKSWFFWCKR